jgi:hypothetical protein
MQERSLVERVEILERKVGALEEGRRSRKKNRPT